MDNVYKKKIAFIVNSKAGRIGKKDKVSIIKKRALLYNFEIEVILWEYPEQYNVIREQIAQSDFDVIVAVGGDGTVNAVAKALIGTNKAFGIIPSGSGNGLARHLGIPLNIRSALDIIYGEGKEISIDAGLINDEMFFCTAGVGFDALIGKLFAESKSRGLQNYARLVLQKLRNYEAESYTLFINGRQVREKAFLITFANASQYGNNAFIAPHADIQDGLLDVVILNSFPLWNVPGLIIKLFNKTLDTSSFVQTYRASDIRIERSSSSVHYDGETVEMGKELSIRVKKACLKIIVPDV